MKTHPYTQLIAAVCLGALASCANSPTPTKIPVSASIRPSKSSANGLFNEVNAYRRSQGRQEVTRHAGLDRLAQKHCEYLRAHRGTFSVNGKNVSHIGFPGRALIARERYQMENISENVAAGNRSHSSANGVIMTLWKGSGDHNRNMLDDWSHSGIGMVVDSDGMVFAAQLFSTVTHSQMVTRERFNGF